MNIELIEKLLNGEKTKVPERYIKSLVSEYKKLHEEKAKLREEVERLNKHLQLSHEDDQRLANDMNKLFERAEAAEQRAEKAESLLACSYKSFLDGLSCDVFAGSKEHELSQVMHKRDIEQKIKGFSQGYDYCRNNWFNVVARMNDGDSLAHDRTRDKRIEQLRKELSND